MPTPENLPIGIEREKIKKEAEFLNGAKNREYVGLLTNTPLDNILTAYPKIAQGMILLYNYAEGNTIDPATKEGFLDRHLKTLLYAGRLITDEEVERMREDINKGTYSKQLDAYLRQKRQVNFTPANEENSAAFSNYISIKSDSDAVYNKRASLSRTLWLKSSLQNTFGEVNYKQAMVAEMVLSAPFFESVLSMQQISEEAAKRHQAYIDETVSFAKDFKPEERFQKFDELTGEYPVPWVAEVRPGEVIDFDKPYIYSLYDFAGSALEGNWDLDSLYKLYKDTILRRGRFFEATAVSVFNQVVVQLLPARGTSISFADIVGYGKQKRFYRNLLEKTKERDPIIGDVRIVIAAGKPGLGKSIGVEAFLNNLPENAKGVTIRINPDLSRGKVFEYEALIKIAKFHPDLELFAVIEDIDKLAGDRLSSRTTSQFLEIDSAVADAIPGNFHLIATTNRPDVVDPAIISRPGRTSEVLVYGYPNEKNRKKIAEHHAGKNGLNLSDKQLETVATGTKGFSPDEVRHIIWSFKFNNITNPTDEEIEEFIAGIKRRHELEKQTSGMTDQSSKEEEWYEDSDEYFGCEEDEE